MNRKHFLLLALAPLLLLGGARAQVAVEVFTGHKKASFDAMFFKYFQNRQEQPSKFLFFSRTRGTVDYKMTGTSNLPAFGLTEAVSYNHPTLKGFAPVMVVQLFNTGIYPKAGIQFFHYKNGFTVFTWLVAETLKTPGIDYFLLMRYMPPLTSKLRLFSQFESVNAFPTETAKNLVLTQRLRLGLSVKAFQFGAGADLTATGRTSFTNTSNAGGFLRYEFR